MVRDAPDISELEEKVISFIDDNPIVGQNIKFDLGFLSRVGIEFSTGSIDTSRLARLLMPNHKYGGLSGLAEGLGVDFRGESHRALADAETTAAVFVELCNRLLVISSEERLKLAQLVAFESSGLAAVIAGEEVGTESTVEKTTSFLPEKVSMPDRLEPVNDGVKIDPVDFEKALNGSKNVIENFEERPQQSDMAAIVKKSLETEGRFLIEAGTGVGKSLAYLLPAALFALKSGKHVVISTNTIALQEQIINKDLPAVREVLLQEGLIQGPQEFRSVLLKGRSNYLCTKRWIEHPKALNDSDIGVLAASLALWLPGTKTGDRAELRLTPSERTTWNRFCAEGADCLSEHNSFVREGRCFLSRARQEADAAHVIVVNHALLLADAKSGGSVIPTYDHLILDEVHNLEQQATQQFGVNIGSRDIQRVLDLLFRFGSSDQRPLGVFSVEVFPEIASLPGTNDICDSIASIREKTQSFFQDLYAVVDEFGVSGRLLLTSSTVTSSSWEKAYGDWLELQHSIQELVSLLKAQVQLIDTHNFESASVVKDNITSTMDILEELIEQIGNFFEELPSSNFIGWVSGARRDNVTLNSAPVSVGPVLEDVIFSRCTTVVATSATLTVSGSTKFTADSLGLSDAETHVLGSPFDYKGTTLLAKVTNIPDPRENGYAQSAADAIIELVLASAGRALVLLTSHNAIGELSRLTRDALEKEGITVLRQGIDGTPARLVEHLKTDPKAVIFGTASLWEGIDIRGEALSLLVIARLPFNDPTDPIHKARSEIYENGFLEYALPLAILRFRQGFGRLIRDRKDVGVVAVLDSRLTTKRYGATFLKALPGCTEITGSARTISKEIQTWLNR